MESTYKFNTSNRGAISLKRALFVLALAAALVFAFSSVAMAKYAGYGYNVDGGRHVGYLSWNGAVAVNPAQAGTSPHGGYTANTTKCAVCHSVHRAATDQTAAGVGAYWKLTPGGNSCIACHTATGSNPSALLVEWPSLYADGGPHRSFNCMGQCHAGVHGGIASEYGTAAKFLLNPNRSAGTTNGYDGMDDGLTAAIAAGNIGGGVTEANLVTWPALAGERQGVRAMVTGYLCGQPGCHTGSQFAVNADGYAEGRTLPANATNGPYDEFFTGHNTSATTTVCSSSGCHSVAGGVGDSKCATCHDFRGVVTNTSAWPHANRGIDVYEWIRPSGNLEVNTTAVVSGNLWMYTGDVTFRDEFGEPTQTAMWDGFLVRYPPIFVQGYESEFINTRTVLQGNAAFNLSVGTPGNIQDGVCLKCHGYKYWPFHGGYPGWDSFGDPSSPAYEHNFANY